MHLRLWWRVAVVAVLAGMFAYVGSFAFPASYQSSTRLLIRGRDATVLSSTGQDLSQQPGVVDSSLAAALGATQSALVNSRTVAEQIVDELKLDAPTKESGLGHVLKTVVGGSIQRVRAYVNHGFYKKPDRREQAIEDVSKGLIAKQVGDSYVISLTGTGETAGQARDITNLAADLLVAISRERGLAESSAHRDALKAQLDQAWTDSRSADSAVTDFKQANGISDLETTLSLSAGEVEQMRDQLRQTEADLSAARAQLATTNSQLRSTPSTSSNSTQIVTGRSSTEVSATADNAAYLSLLASSQRLQADVSGLEAKRDSILRAIDQNPSGSAPASATEASLRQLQMQSVVAADVVKSLNADYQKAVSDASSGAVELNRLDQAGLSTYPVKPTRWLFLLLGIVFGGLVGFSWTYVRLRRRGYFHAPVELLERPTWAVPAQIDLRDGVLTGPAQNGNHKPVPAPERTDAR